MAAPFSIRTFLLLGGLLALSLQPPQSLAQTAATDSVSVDSVRVQWEKILPPLTVTAGRLPTAPAQAPARVTVLDSAALNQTGATSAASALEARAGLFVRQYSEGGLATPALRGSGASQTALLLDGQPISDPQIGHLDLSLLPTVLLQSIEVMHGPASPLHGSDGLGGAIHLHTIRAPSTLQVRGTAQVGAFGERGGSLLTGGRLSGETSVIAAAEYHATDGDFPYRDASQFPAETVRRRNADRARGSVFASVRSEVRSHQLRLSGWVTRAERGLPPSSATGPAHERQWDTQLRLWGRDRVPVGAGEFTVRGLTQHTQLRYTNPAQDLDQTGRTWIHSLESTLRMPVGTHWAAAGGLSGSFAQARHPRLEAPAHQEHLAAFTEGTGQYGRLRLYPALRADTYWMPDGQTRLAVSPRLGLNWQPIPAWSPLHVKAQLGRAFRVPTFNDRYWQPGGNPDLQPERSWGGDAGLWLGDAQRHVELTAFGHRRRNQIVWRPAGDGNWAPENVGKVRALGAEASATGEWILPVGPSLQGGLTYTYTDARNRADPGSSSYNERVRYVPRDQLKIHSTVSWGPAAVTVHGRYTGRRYLTSDGRQFLQPFLMTNTRLRLEHTFAGVYAALSLQVDNVLNIDYRSIDNHPMPPRHARVRLHIAP